MLTFKHFALLALGLGVVCTQAEEAPSGQAPPPTVHACARLAGLPAPDAVAGRFRDLPIQVRRQRVLQVLRSEIVERSAPVLAEFRLRGCKHLRPLWNAGVVCGEAPRAVWDMVAQLPTVEEVFEDPPRSELELLDTGGPNESVPPEAPLIAMHVPEAWGRGFTGRGVLVALIDTGVEMTHPDLTGQIWTNPGEVAGNGLDDDGNGYIDDLHGWDFASNDNDPTDAAGHGTRAAGLIIGNGAAGKQTGAAPGATLMVLRRGTTQESLWDAALYALENGADILSQSISWKYSFEPRPHYPTWRYKAEVELAAGMIHTNSGGNSGEQLDTEPIPYNVAAPANNPPPYLLPQQPQQGGTTSVLGVGNVDARSLAISAQSPYGPAEWADIKAHQDPTYPYDMPLEYQDYPWWNGALGLLKPDIVAPGDGSVSTDLGGGYGSFTGTSAATPRVAAILALMKQAAPLAGPADLAQALLTTARDLGPAGPDNRYGAGSPEAAAAIDALGPPLQVISAEIVDPGFPRGDGDGGADAGEIDRLVVTVKNTSAQALTNVELILAAASDAEVKDGYAFLASIPGGGTADSGNAFTLSFPSGSCGRMAELTLQMRAAGQRRVEPLFLTIGTRTTTSLLTDDFETNQGWTVSGGASQGAWVRATPVGTYSSGQPVAPGADHTLDPGEKAYVTGNGSTDPNGSDVDNGTTTLRSPARDARGFTEVEITYYRWFFGSDSAGEDALKVEATGDGTTWKTIEEVTVSEAVWRPRRIILSDLITPGASTMVRFVVQDAVADDTVEGGLDDVTLNGMAVSCSAWSIPADPTPGPVGSTLHVQRTPAGHLNLSWDPPSASGGSDPAAGYQVARSTQPNTEFSVIGNPLAPQFTDIDGASSSTGPLRCFLVESVAIPVP